MGNENVVEYKVLNNKVVKSQNHFLSADGIFSPKRLDTQLAGMSLGLFYSKSPGSLLELL